MRPFTPTQLAPTSQALRTLAALDDAALARTLEDRVPVEDEGWLSRWLGGTQRARRRARAAWLREAIAPWRRPDGPRSFHMRSDGRVTLGKFAEREDEVLVVVVEGGMLRGVRVLTSGAYGTFGTEVGG